MTKPEKLIARNRRRPPQARFADVQAVLEAHGWHLDRQKGSHVTFAKRGQAPIVVPKDNEMVGRRYLDVICDRLGLDESGEGV